MVTGQWARIKGQCTFMLCVTHGDGLIRVHGNLIGIDKFDCGREPLLLLYVFLFFQPPSGHGNDGRLEDYSILSPMEALAESTVFP